MWKIYVDENNAYLNGSWNVENILVYAELIDETFFIKITNFYSAAHSHDHDLRTGSASD
jgi:hypothetical protein